MLPAEADAEPLADQGFVDAGAAALDHLVVSGDVHVVAGLIVACGLFPPASAVYLELLVSVDAASPHSGPRR